MNWANAFLIYIAINAVMTVILHDALLRAIGQVVRESKSSYNRVYIIGHVIALFTMIFLIRRADK